MSGSAAATSDFFTIWDIRIASPVAGDEWTVGTTQGIQWTYEPYQGEVVRIDLSRDGGSNWEVIADDVPADAATYWWDVTAPVSSDCVVRVSSQDEHYRERVSEVFSIVSLVLRVDLGNVAGPWDGATWATAYEHPQDALDVLPDPCPGVEIWVAEGTYTRRTSAEEVVVTMKDGASLYGGFAGTETTRSQRMARAHTTTLDGENVCQHVVLGAPEAVLDGFSVLRGNAVGPGIGTEAGGGGLLYRPPSAYDERPLRIADCTFSDNYAYWCGGAVYALYGTVEITGCRVARNETTCCCGGGVHLWKCSYATEENPSPEPSIIANCVFTDGRSNAGGGICLHISLTVVWNCIFYYNEAVNDYGGGIHCWQSSPTITNCSMQFNKAFIGGGAMSFFDNSDAEITNTLLSVNFAPVSPQIYADSTSDLTVTYSNIPGGWEGTGNIDADPLVGYVPSTGALVLWPGSPCIDAANGPVAPKFDAFGGPRHDDPGTPNTWGVGPPWADMGASEYQGTTPPGWYVDDDAAAGGDGLSWATAFQHPQDAMNAAEDGDVIWVAEGTYYREPADAQPLLEMQNGVAIYGGFSKSESSILERDLAVHASNFWSRASETTPAALVLGADHAVLDGFRIGSEATKKGMQNTGVSRLTVENCSFQDCSTCAVRNDDCENVVLSNCDFSHNGSPTNEYANALFIENGYPGCKVTDCRFTFNESGGRGAAIFVTVHETALRDRTVPLIKGCTFSSNTGPLPVVTYDLSWLKDDLSVEECRFDNNVGGALEILTKMTVTRNFNIRDCTFGEEGSTEFGAGILVDIPGIAERNLAIHACVFRNHTVSTPVDLTVGSGVEVEITDCRFFDNTTTGSGGAITWSTTTPGSPLSVTKCVFHDNTSTFNGGALWLYATGNSSASLVNCLLYDNEGARGGGIYMSGIEGTTLSVINCTLCDNSALLYGQAIHLAGGGTLTMKNCIVWHHTKKADQITFADGSSFDVTYSDIRGWPHGGLGVIWSTPWFVNRFEKDFHHLAKSPCVDAGIGGFGIPTDDLDGNQRPSGTTMKFDMGAYEYVPE